MHGDLGMPALILLALLLVAIDGLRLALHDWRGKRCSRARRVIA